MNITEDIRNDLAYDLAREIFLPRAKELGKRMTPELLQAAAVGIAKEYAREHKLTPKCKDLPPGMCGSLGFVGVSFSLTDICDGRQEKWDATREIAPTGTSLRRCSLLLDDVAAQTGMPAYRWSAGIGLDSPIPVPYEVVYQLQQHWPDRPDDEGALSCPVGIVDAQSDYTVGRDQNRCDTGERTTKLARLRLKKRGEGRGWTETKNRDFMRLWKLFKDSNALALEAATFFSHTVNTLKKYRTHTALKAKWPEMYAEFVRLYGDPDTGKQVRVVTTTDAHVHYINQLVQANKKQQQQAEEAA